jgi:protoheme IX farnesyltransferase
MSLANDEADLSRAARVASFAPGVARAGDYLALTKPRVMSLVVFTAAVGLLVAPGHLDPVVGFSALLCIAIGAGAAGALNMWYDADVDALMSRTTARPIPRGRILPGEALAFGLTTAAASVIALGLVTNVAATSLLAFTIFFYIVVYTMWLKRSTPQSIVIGRRWSRRRGQGGMMTSLSAPPNRETAASRRQAPPDRRSPACRVF